MSTTFDYILYCQSPALFLAAVALIICFAFRMRNHRIRAILDLILGIVALIGGVFLYYLGMLYEHFTIRDFWRIRIPGWVGLALTAILLAALLYHSIMRRIIRRRSAKAAERAELLRLQELEDAKNTAYASGKADAEAALTSAIDDGVKSECENT